MKDSMPMTPSNGCCELLLVIGPCHSIVGRSRRPFSSARGESATELSVTERCLGRGGDVANMRATTPVALVNIAHVQFISTETLVDMEPLWVNLCRGSAVKGKWASFFLS